MKTSTPFFLTHHAAPGAWLGLTFGVPGQGVSIDHEHNEFDSNADLLVAVSRGPGKVKALPFISGVAELDPETVQREAAAGNLEALPNSPKARWSFIPEAELERKLGACIDTYVAKEFTFRVLSRPPVFSDYEKATPVAKQKAELNPSVLLELEVDNSKSQEVAYAFIGVAIFRERLRTLDLESSKKLCGVGQSSRWVLGALPVKDKVYTVRDGAIAKHVELGSPIAMHKGREGGVMARIEPGHKGVLRVALSVFHYGPSTQNPISHYLYSKHFSAAEEACLYLLKNSAAFIKEATTYDQKLEAKKLSEARRQVIAQAIRAYAANTQLTFAGSKVFFNVPEGQYYWRNTMDLCADHLPFEMAHSPWVVRHLMDRFLSTYSFKDQLRFPGENKLYPGGLSFTHDMGSYATWSNKGESLYEQANLTGCYSHMTMEELLNGVFLLGALALSGKEKIWAKKKESIYLAVLESMERRDHFDPAKRDGILKGESNRVGPLGAEITSYDALDHSLMAARGNGYIALKTFSAALILEACFKVFKNKKAEARAARFARLTAESLENAFDRKRGIFPANLFESSESVVSAFVESLAVPRSLGLTLKLETYQSLMDKVKLHMNTCLRSGVCLDEETGGLRLSSTSSNTWPSKTALVIDVCEKVLGIDLMKIAPSVIEEYVGWCQVAARETSISDQILSDTRQVKGGSWYPRIVTTWLWTID